MARENEQDHDSVWRHLDLGVWRLEVHARLRRLRCPEHGVHVEGVPFARDGARFTRDFENLVAWLMTKTDRTATCRLVRIDWETVGRIIKRVGDELLPGRPAGGDLFEVSLDEVAWRKGHRYLTLVGRSPRKVRGVGHRGQGAGRRRASSLTCSTLGRTVRAARASRGGLSVCVSQPSAIMVPSARARSCSAGGGHPGRRLYGRQRAPIRACSRAPPG